MAGMDLDLRKLKGDVAKRQAARPVGIAPGGRRATGSMAIVRQHLADFDALRAKGATWAEIAAGLAEQGVTQGENREPITAKRLTAIVTLVRKAEVKRAEVTAQKASRADLRRDPAPPTATDRTRLALAPELRTPDAPSASSVHEAEEEYRLNKLRRVEGFFKPDPSDKDR